MGCCTRMRKDVDARPEQKWDYINLNDFKSSGCGTPFAYVYLWFMLFISVAVYGVDTFTAVNLLIFDQWSSEIEPTVKFEITKWIFSICIIASFVNLGFEQFRAHRVMRRGNIAECYLDNIAVRLESTRFGKGKGFRRFLVFAELTKNKKGAEYVALFAYFSFQSWIRVLLCSGPRQVINAMTLVGVYNARLSSEEAENIGEGFLEFFRKVGALGEESYQQALILSGMCFTLVVWAFSALFLLISIFFYIFFLWHWIPKADGGLSGYCERKVNTALTKIVHDKVNKAFAKEEKKKIKAELKEARKNGIEEPSISALSRQATLPTLPDMGDPDKLPDMPMLDKKESVPNLPPYTSRPASPGSIEMGAMQGGRPMASRSATMNSNRSYASNAPLIDNGANMGHSSPLSPPPGSVSSGSVNTFGPPARPGTAQSQRSARGPMGHSATFSSASSDVAPPMPAPVRSPTGQSFGSYGPMSHRGSPAPSRSGGYGEYTDNRSASPAPSIMSDRSAGTPAPLRPGPGPGPRPGVGPYGAPQHQGYGPTRSATGPLPPRGPPGPQQYGGPHRNMTAPMPPRADDYMQRPGTAQSYRSNPRGPPPGQGIPRPGGYGRESYDTDVESQRDYRY